MSPRVYRILQPDTGYAVSGITNLRTGRRSSVVLVIASKLGSLAVG